MRRRRSRTARSHLQYPVSIVETTFHIDNNWVDIVLARHEDREGTQHREMRPPCEQANPHVHNFRQLVQVLQLRPHDVFATNRTMQNRLVDHDLKRDRIPFSRKSVCASYADERVARVQGRLTLEVQN